MTALYSLNKKTEEEEEDSIKVDTDYKHRNERLLNTAAQELV
jgi:hypothetical protein